ncbi:MAG TPA: hypothetical protein VHF47_05725 [Acidimicrobiales bacterium]|nr:hypothetical protein [Acidimicrobiales bacterium]
MPDPRWERRRGDPPELFALDLFTPDGSLAGFVGLAFQAGVAWYWAGLVGDGRPYLLVRDADVALPRSSASLELRAEGLWADHTCETPFDHWSYGLEAFGVALDDPDEALGAERGDRTPLGFDLDWEATAEPDGGDGAYAQPGIVHGEVLVGSERLAFDGLGWRRHEWGGISAAGFAGVTADGGPVRQSPVEPAAVVTLHRAPLVLPGGVLDRRLGRVGDALGWAEWLRPPRPG